MTYSIVDLFSQLFRTTSDEYYTTEKINGHIPSASDYSAHLMRANADDIISETKESINTIIETAQEIMKRCDDWCY